MRRLWLAIRIFWRVLIDASAARQVEPILRGEGIGRPEVRAEVRPEVEQKKPELPAAAARPAHSEALTLLAALQRESRLVDLVKEPLEAYSDAQIGAAARDVLRSCGKVLDRFFALQPVVEQPEGAELEVPAGFDPGQYRLVGNVAGEAPFRGALRHPGWKATQCELPVWSGSPESAWVVAAAEVELK